MPSVNGVSVVAHVASSKEAPVQGARGPRRQSTERMRAEGALTASGTV
jgi:hypothetical protein